MAVPVMAIAALAQAGYQMYQGHKQKEMAKKLKPSNYVPPGLKEAEALAKGAANATTAPGFGILSDRLKTQGANTVDRIQRSTSNPNLIQQAVADTDAREKEIMKDLAINNEAFRAQNRNQVIGLAQRRGAYEKDSWDAFNATKSALMGAGMRNQYNAVTGLFEGLIMSGVGEDKDKDTTGAGTSVFGSQKLDNGIKTHGSASMFESSPSALQKSLTNPVDVNPAFMKDTSFSDIARLYRNKLMSIPVFSSGYRTNIDY